MTYILGPKPPPALLTGFQRDARWARSRRAQLIDQLGGCCALCASTDRLEIDHVDGRSYSLRNLSQASRVRRYLRELADGVRLRVLCRGCNAKLGGKRRYA